MKSLKLLLTVLFLGLFVANVFAASEKGSMASTTVQKLKPKEIKVDRNNDGKVDRVEIFNDQGVLIRVETDTKGDGKIHEWVYYENGRPVKAEKDLTGNGKPNMTLYYDAKGQIVKSEADTKGDGKIHEWVYYENGKPVKAEKDSTGDGKPDTWLTY